MADWVVGQTFSESTHCELQHHVIKKITGAFCGCCNRITVQLQCSTKGLDNDYSLFCTRCELKNHNGRTKTPESALKALNDIAKTAKWA